MKNILTSLILILSACSADGKLGREESPHWHDRVSTAEKVKYFTPTCIAYGHKPGSPELQKCVVEEIRISKQNANDRMNAILNKDRTGSIANTGFTCRTFGNTTRCD